MAEEQPAPAFPPQAVAAPAHSAVAPEADAAALAALLLSLVWELLAFLLFRRPRLQELGLAFEHISDNSPIVMVRTHYIEEESKLCSYQVHRRS